MLMRLGNASIIWQFYGGANLRYFETLSDIGVSTRVKRSNGVQELIKIVKFKVFKREFHLILKSGTNVLTKDFTAHLVNDQEGMTSFFVDQSQLYTGHLYDNPNIAVNAHLEDTLWSIQIFEMNNTYALEPAWILLNATENPNNDSMMAYRSSDLISSAGRCGTQSQNVLYNFDPDFTKYDEQTSYFTTKKNPKRQINRVLRDTCQIQVIADYFFYANRCKRNYKICTNIMISFIQNLDRIYRSTKFFSDRQFGVQIRVLLLYSSPTETYHDGKMHFNSIRTKWTAEEKLESFAYYMGLRYKFYCLSTLFTHYPFELRVLGIAFMASVCIMKPWSSKQLSTSLISGHDIATGFVPSLQLNIVLVHGHNFGAAHDPVTKECFHEESEGGNYIMWARSVTGEHRNNKVFSPCSVRSISKNLEWARCLVYRDNASGFCGNGIVDSGEQCDEGDNSALNSSCCTSNCTFQSEAVCCDMNTECCLNCHVAPAGTVCFNSGNNDCKGTSVCNGRNLICPQPQNLPDWTPCMDVGRCVNGTCRGFCEILSIKDGVMLKSCMCRSSDSSACKWCCFNTSDPDKPGPCIPYSNDSLKDGRPCYAGYCEKGICKQQMTSTVLRVFDFLTSLNISKFGKFMRTNIVFAVIVLSCILWIPPSCVVHRLDKREREDRELAREFYRQVFENNTGKLSQSSLATPDDSGDLIYDGSTSSREVSFVLYIEKPNILCRTPVTREGQSPIRIKESKIQKAGTLLMKLNRFSFTRRQAINTSPVNSSERSFREDS